MALPGLSPPEIAFCCEMEQVTVIPRQRLESLQLLGGPTPVLRPPHRADIPLWLALLLKRQRRADIVPPPWLNQHHLEDILNFETNEKMRSEFSPGPSLPPPRHSTTSTPPFTRDSVADDSAAARTEQLLPYHWLELGQTLLADAADDIPDAEAVRRLLRDLREVRMAKVRAKVDGLTGGAGVNLNGLGAIEVGESRAFVIGVIDGLRSLGASWEQAERERMEEEGGAAGLGADEDDEDEDML